MKNTRTARLVFFCGKMGAGKSTASKTLSAQQNAVLISEDHWLSTLYPNRITSFQDYLDHASLLRPLVKALVVNILQTGTDVVMDFPANTVNQREWFKTILAETGAAHELVYLEASDETCLKQIAMRRVENPERAIFDTESVFHAVTRHFQQPKAEEGFNVRIEKRVG